MSLKVAITGNSYSGFGNVCQIFSETFRIKVFDADVVLKFLLNYRQDILKQAKIRLGSDIFDKSDFIISEKFNTTEKFDKLLDVCWRELIYLYELWRLKHKNESYTVFKCSVIFEYNKERDFDRVINVYIPKEDRIKSYTKNNSNTSAVNAYVKMCSEMSDLEKNQLTAHIIHNYVGSIDTVINQIKKMDDSFKRYVELTSSKDLTKLNKTGRIFMDSEFYGN